MSDEKKPEETPLHEKLMAAQRDAMIHNGFEFIQKHVGPMEESLKADELRLERLGLSMDRVEIPSNPEFGKLAKQFEVVIPPLEETDVEMDADQLLRILRQDDSAERDKRWAKFFEDVCNEVISNSEENPWKKGLHEQFEEFARHKGLPPRTILITTPGRKSDAFYERALTQGFSWPITFSPPRLFEPSFNMHDISSDLFDPPTFESEYLHIGKQILDHGAVKGDRTGTGTWSLFGKGFEIDISDNKIPLLTTKEVLHNSIVHELVWFLSGSTDIRYLKKNNISFWDSWVIPETADWVDVDFMNSHRNESYSWPFELKQTTNDKINWIRCHDETLYKMWKREDAAYLASINLTGKIPLPQRFADFWQKAEAAYAAVFKEMPVIPNVTLGGGSIGNAAYGALWRRWEDLRLVDPAKKEYFSELGYRVMTKGGDSTNFDHPEAVLVNGKMLLIRHVDQIREACKLLRYNPESRRIIVTGWNPARLDEAVLPPCHTLFQFNSYRVEGKEKPQLEIQLYQRSADLPVGVPFNIASYALLAHKVALVTGHEAARFVWQAGDVHIYKNQIQQFREQLTRPQHAHTAKVEFTIPEGQVFGDPGSIKADMVKIVGYDAYGSRIDYPVAV